MENQEKKPKTGISLFNIKYELDTKGNSNRTNYSAGIIAYSSEEAVKTLIEFCKKQIRGFKGVKIDEVSFEGGCHAISDQVRKIIIDKAITDGLAVSVEANKNITEELKKANTTKKSILKKEVKS